MQANRADLLGMHAGSQDSMLNKLNGSLAMLLPSPWDMDFVGDFLKQLSAAVGSAWVRARDVACSGQCPDAVDDDLTAIVTA